MIVSAFFESVPIISIDDFCKFIKNYKGYDISIFKQGSHVTMWKRDDANFKHVPHKDVLDYLKYKAKISNELYIKLELDIHSN